MQSNISLAIIGVGRWGKNHLKTALTILKPEQIVVCDVNEDSRNYTNSVSPNVSTCSDLNDVLNNPSINAVIVATPAETHFDIASKIIAANKNVLVEKPLALSTSEAVKLTEMASNKECKLMVGHVLLYHPAVRKIKSDLHRIGNLQYIYSNRLNLGAVRSEENILWSFAPHDISIIQYLIGKYPTSIVASGNKYLQPNVEDTTITNLNYSNNIAAHIYVSWLHPFKEQRLVVIGDKGMYVFDDTLKTGKLKFHSKGFHSINGSLEKFECDEELIPIENEFPLTNEQKHFFECIINNKNPLTDGNEAIEVLKIIEEAQNSMNSV